MFGLEGEKNNKNAFEFDLEKDLKSDSKKKKEIQQAVDGSITELKKILREGSSDIKEFEKFGTLLRGYAALQKVMSRIAA